jgi:hypothetical protein
MTPYRFIDEMDRVRFDDAILKSNGTVILSGAGNFYGPCEYDSTNWPFEEWTCVFTLTKTSDEDSMVQTTPFNPSTNIVSVWCKCGGGNTGFKYPCCNTCCY